jgi:phage/plasmid-associated DNA primase
MCSSLPDPRDVLTVLDIITAIAIRMPFEVIVLLFGRGNNSKGLLENVILTLFTMARITAIKLEEMKRSRFGPGALLNKDAWIVTEVESVNEAMSVLKAEASGEMIDSDVKHRERIQGRPHALSIIDANNPLEFKDNSYGRKRRILKLDFPYTFGDGADMRPIDRQLKNIKVVHPDVLSGIVQIIAARAPVLVESMWIYRRKGTEEQEDEIRRQQYHLATFFDECVSNNHDPESGMPERLKVDDVYVEYIEYCKLFNVTAPAEKVPFGRYISERYGTQSVSTTETVKGKRVSFRYYPDVEFEGMWIELS